MKFDVKTLQTPLVDSPFMEALMESHGYLPEQKDLCRRYARDGFLIFDLNIPDFDALAAQIQSDVAKELATQSRVMDAWRTSAAIKSLAAMDSVKSLLGLLYGRRAIPFQTLNFRVGTQQSTHSDTLHFNSVPERFMCGVWVALEDMDERNGPLHYYPGSHRLPRYDLSDLGIAASEYRHDIKSTYGGEIPKLIGAIAEAMHLEKKQALVKKGQGVIWAANVYHGGEPILDKSRTRHSQVTHYYFENCAYYAPYTSDVFLGEPHLRKVVDISTGEDVPQVYCGKPLDLPRGLSLRSFFAFDRWGNVRKQVEGLRERFLSH